MKRNVMIYALAGAAIAVSAPAFSKPGGGNGGGNGNAGATVGATAGGRIGAGAGSGATMGGDVSTTVGSSISTRGNGGTMGSMSTTGRGGVNATSHAGSAMDMRASAQNRRDTARANSQGPAHANVNGLTHANSNSVLANAGVTTLTGLAAGATVNNTGGTLLGTVDSIVTNKSGAVVGVNVTLDSGGTVFIPATTLTMDGTTVVTTFVPHG